MSWSLLTICEIPGIVGYDETVLPSIENAILAGQDIVFLGERGQAKTRLARTLVNLLDEWMPVVRGGELNDDPFAPISAAARAIVAEGGDVTPIDWIHRDRRRAKKLSCSDQTQNPPSCLQCLARQKRKHGLAKRCAQPLKPHSRSSGTSLWIACSHALGVACGTRSNPRSFTTIFAKLWHFLSSQRRLIDRMPTRNINLTHEQDEFVESIVRAGEYQNASEAI